MTDIDRGSLEEWLANKSRHTGSAVMSVAYEAVLKELRAGRFAVEIDGHAPDVLPELPAGCLETGRTIVRSYLNEDGKSLYTIHTRGERSKFDVIGSLEVAKYDILALGWGNGEDE